MSSSIHIEVAAELVGSVCDMIDGSDIDGEVFAEVKEFTGGGAATTVSWFHPNGAHATVLLRFNSTPQGQVKESWISETCTTITSHFAKNFKGFVAEHN